MNFLLKIIQGPNAGAEIALVEGLTVSLGKADSCDIVLADPTLPDQPLQIETRSDSVRLTLPGTDGERLEPFHVKTVGTTAFAVGPSDAAWGELVWPPPPRAAEAEPVPAEKAEPAQEAPAAPSAPESGTEAKPSHSRRGCFGCLVVLLLLLLLLGGAIWFFRKPLTPYYHEKLEPRVTAWWGKSKGTTEQPLGEIPEAAQPPASIEQVAERHALTLTNRNSRMTLTGNLATRAERLTATAESYAVDPSVELDLSDDESMRTMAEDTLAMMGEGALQVAAATNRVVSLSGKVGSEAALRKVLEVLSAEVPHLANVDCGKIVMAAAPALNVPAPAEEPAGAPVVARKRKPAGTGQRDKQPDNLPVCGILTVPYPCLVLKNGTRLIEGAQVGESTIVKIEPDAVTLTNAMGRFVWKP
ncbi:MAG: hypothetical protein J6336_08295 [Kiritimatiellae bacterium]|nr:hypothetical protein [Kiritimatiellia bacterium]